MALAEKAGVGGQSTQLGKAAALNAYLKNTFPYANDGSDHYQMSSIFSLTEYGKGKCAGFAMTLARALNTLGIDAYFAKASLRSTEDHAVVRAFLDGRWYTIEATPSIGMKQTSTANELEKIKSSGFSIVSSEAGLNQVKTVYVNADAEQWLLDNNRRFGY